MSKCLTIVGWTAHDNVVSNSAAGLIIGGGRRNKVYNNHFYNITNGGVWLDNRGMRWQSEYCSNITELFGQELVKYNYTYPPYSVQYPETVNDFNENPCMPAFNLIVNNTYCLTNFSGEPGVTPEVAKSWNSTMEGNYEYCMLFFNIIEIIHIGEFVNVITTGTTGTTGIIELILAESNKCRYHWN